MRRAASAPALLAAALLSACMGIPESGSVHEVPDPQARRQATAADIVVQPPRPGESARDIVDHFLDAMEASPLSTAVAREFLTPEAAAAWNPELGTIVYSAKSPPTGGSPVEVELSGAGHLDARGSWLGSLAEDRSTLRFPMTKVDGEWRIAEAPNALIVGDSWFAQRFQQVSVYFFDPRGQVLVPEPVYLPTGDQLPTYLIRDLVLGPGRRLADVERSFVPPGTTARLSITVSAAGRADVALQGDSSQLTPRASELMLTQLAWTLKQVPDITSLAVTVGGQPVRPANGSPEILLDYGLLSDPTGSLAPIDVFGLRDGLLVSGPLDDLRPVDGPLGRAAYGLRSVAIDPAGRQVAGVTTRGHSVVVSPLLQAEDTGAQEVASAAQDLLAPVWDLAGRLWLVDRRAEGALVTVWSGSQLRRVTVPGVSGKTVTAFAVSRDGSRFVAVVRGADGDEVRVARVPQLVGTDLTTGPSVSLPWSAIPNRVLDLGWASPTSLLVLYPLSSQFAELRLVSVDGSASSGLPPGTTLRGRPRYLVSSPVGDQPWYAAAAGPRRVVDSSGAEFTASLRGVRLSTLTYAG